MIGGGTMTHQLHTDSEDREYTLFVNPKELYQKIEKLKEQGYRNVLITAPIESGKTSFIYKYLMGNPDNKIAIFTNRTLLKEQVNYNVRLRQQMSIKPVEVEPYCYQLIGMVLDEDKASKDLEETLSELSYDEERRAREAIEGNKQFIREGIKEMDYIVLDEAHYFTTDSTFNKNTLKEFEYILKNSSGMNIFLTATPQALLKAIRRYEKINHVEDKDKLQEVKLLKQMTVDEYIALDQADQPIPEHIPIDIVDHYSNLLTFEFIHERERDKRLEEELKISNPNNKLIYFTNNKQRGINIYHMAKGMHLADNSLNGGSFLCSLYVKEFSEYIDKEERNRISLSKRFSSDVLVTTSALDNGIDIIDDKVKRVIIEYTNYDEAIQMLGRVRTKKREQDNPIHIIIVIPNYNSVKWQLVRTQGKISDASNIFEEEQLKYQVSVCQDIMSLIESKDAYVSEGYRDDEKMVTEINIDIHYLYFLKLFSYLTGGDVSFNSSQVSGLETLYRNFKKDIREKEEKEERQTEKRERKQLEKRKEQYQKKLQQVECCCSQYLDKELLKDDFDIFVEELDLRNKDNNRVIRSESGINKKLEKLKSKYRIEKEKVKEGINRDKRVYKVIKI